LIDLFSQVKNYNYHFLFIFIYSKTFDLKLLIQQIHYKTYQR